MRVGAKCSGCEKAIAIGKTEIESDAEPLVLHAQLRSEGWLDQHMTDLDKQCGATTFVPVESTFLLGPVEILTERVEYP